MADLALRLKVFVASPGDLLSERDIVERIVGVHAADCARHRLLLQSFRWENGTTPGYERPNARTIRSVRTAELTVVMFWSRLGSAATLGSVETGSLEELRIAGEQVRTGASDDVFVYFKNAPPPAGTAEEELRRVAALRASLESSKEVFAAEFCSQLEFEDKFRQHIRLWTERWQGVPEICEFALDNSGGGHVNSELLADDRLHQVLMWMDLPSLGELLSLLGRESVDTYQRVGPTGWLVPLKPSTVEVARRVTSTLEIDLFGPATDVMPAADLARISGPPLTVDGAGCRFTQPAWFFFFCAVGLLDAVRAARVDAVVRRPYINDVHQFFKALAREFRGTAQMTPILRRWLLSEDGCTDNRPVARNFAAYSLGMIGAVDAQDDLFHVVQNDRGRDVKLYAISALGKLRARQQLPGLKEVFARETDNDIRLMLAQAVCRMTGVAEYEM